jgi:serine/threonine protein kinase
MPCDLDPNETTLSLSLSPHLPPMCLKTTHRASLRCMQSQLVHPNLVKLFASLQWTFDASPKQHHMVLVMELCRGSLEDKLGTGKGRGGLGSTDLLHVTRDCVAGLSFMRRMNSIHRDIKAVNVCIHSPDTAVCPMHMPTRTYGHPSTLLRALPTGPLQVQRVSRSCRLHAC